MARAAERGPDLPALKLPVSPSSWDYYILSALDPHATRSIFFSCGAGLEGRVVQQVNSESLAIRNPVPASLSASALGITALHRL